ncbi:DNA-directed RNA polymerase I subunit RPA34 [Hyla sarda]|uniref:DNA-directed RNA polymerase I subunit RPA34 n=1 Tax=Hyla sarda TaxID=327740 RepID=UPI0024C2C52A|nr:DNA-directed RNA polymerase I subunit RPA34 [Hyla sarda]
MEGGRCCSFRCPLDFAPVASCDGAVTLEPDTEFWLIKTPVDFTPERFDSHRFPLSGSKMQKIKDGGVKKYYHMVSSPGTALPLQAFLRPSEDQLVATAPLQGVITLAEAHGDHSALHSVPDRPPLTIPPGLKQRYRPFGVSEAKRKDPQVSGSSKKKKKAKKRRHEETVED